MLLGGSMIALSGCSSPEVLCPAIGYSSTLSVQFSGDTEQLADVVVCGGPDCEEADALQDPGLWTRAEQPLTGQGSWTAVLFSPGVPLVVRALDAQGGVLLETHVEPEWVRVGGTEECGGPAEAGVVLEI